MRILMFLGIMIAITALQGCFWHHQAPVVTQPAPRSNSNRTQPTWRSDLVPPNANASMPSRASADGSARMSDGGSGNADATDSGPSRAAC
jgi:hypothetical protein